MSLPGAANPRPELMELLRGLDKIPAHREVLLRLNGMLGDDDHGMNEIVDLVRLDVGLAARVLAAANTIFFRGGLPIGSVDEAVIRVGFNEVKRLLFSSIVFELTGGALRSYGLAPGELWNRSLACALAMDLLAGETRRSQDVCHTIGLMHALGLVAIDRWLSKRGDERGPSLGDPCSEGLAEREREAVGFTHAEVGGSLLQSWHFPESVVTAVASQEAPFRADRFRRVACLLALARWLMRMVLAGEDTPDRPPMPDKVILHLAGVSEERLSELVAPLGVKFQELKAAVGVF